MADHVRLAARIGGMNGKVMTSLPYEFAMELRDRQSRTYREASNLGVRDAYTPLDWANLGLGVQQLGRDRRGDTRNALLFEYIAAMQGEFEKGTWRRGSPNVQSKHDWIETYYFPQGMSRYPAFGRLLFGFYLFNLLFGSGFAGLWA